MKEKNIKPLIFIVFCFFSAGLFGQDSSKAPRKWTILSNATPPKWTTVDSLKFEIQNLRSSIGGVLGYKGTIKKQEYLIRYLKDLKKLDTIHNDRDSLIIIAIDKNDKLLRKTTKKYIEGMTDSVVIFYNDRGLLEYGEVWLKSSTIGSSLNYHRMQTYRYEYDKQDRKIEFVIWAQTPLMKRLMFSYDENGEQVVTTEKPGAIYFWD